MTDKTADTTAERIEDALEKLKDPMTVERMKEVVDRHQDIMAHAHACVTGLCATQSDLSIVTCGGLMIVYNPKVHLLHHGESISVDLNGVYDLPTETVSLMLNYTRVIFDPQEAKPYLTRLNIVPGVRDV